MPHPAIFLDRDGTLIKEAEYLSDPAGVELLPGAAAGIRALRDAGYRVVVTSNQSGVARGYFDEDAVRRVNQRAQSLLEQSGAGLDGVYYCPHYAGGEVAPYNRACDCRKPEPGMLIKAAQDLDLDLGQSWVVGDKAADIAFGARQGLRTVLVMTGYGRETQARGFAGQERPDYVCDDLAQAARVILEQGPAKDSNRAQ